MGQGCRQEELSGILGAQVEQPGPIGHPIHRHGALFLGQFREERPINTGFFREMDRLQTPLNQGVVQEFPEGAHRVYV